MENTQFFVIGNSLKGPENTQFLGGEYTIFTVGKSLKGPENTQFFGWRISALGTDTYGHVPGTS